MKTYTFTFFDANPHTSSGCEWPDYTDLDIEEESDEEAVSAVRDALEGAAAGLSTEDGYSAGDRVYALAWDEDGVMVADVSYALTEDDVGQ